MNNSKKLSGVLVVLALLAICGSHAAAGPLGDLVEQQGFNWLAGRWKATTDDGTEITLSYRWGLEKNVIFMDFKMGDTASHTMIYLSDNDEVVSLGIDNKGNTSKAAWDVADSKLISKGQYKDPNGQTIGIAYTIERVDQKTMSLELFGVENGQLADYSWWSTEFKRQKRPTTRATQKPNK